MLLTGSGSLADERNELLLYFLHRVQIVHKEDVPVTGLTGNIHQLPIVCIRKANGKDDVAWKCNLQREYVTGLEGRERIKQSHVTLCWSGGFQMRVQRASYPVLERKGSACHFACSAPKHKIYPFMPGSDCTNSGWLQKDLVVVDKLTASDAIGNNKRMHSVT